MWFYQWVKKIERKSKGKELWARKIRNYKYWIPYRLVWNSLETPLVMKGVVLDQKLELWLIDSGSFWDQNGNGRINSIPTFSRSPFSCWWMDSMEKWITMKGIGSISGEPLYLVDCVSATTNGDPVVYCFFHCFIFPSRSLPEGTRRWSCVNCLVIVRWRGKCPKKRTPKKKENRKKRIRSENTWKKKKASIFFLGGGGEKNRSFWPASGFLPGRLA